jgi:hypothetical protein
LLVRAHRRVRADQDLREAVCIFVDKKYRALPVLEKAPWSAPIDVMRAWPGVAKK